jgi:GNAT superfamily N-acetyltransferase
VYVAPDARRGGLGRMLVQGMARDLVERGSIKAVEAFGDTRGDVGWETLQPPRDHPRGSRCVASVEFLGSVGFKTHRPHARHPRMRMDLRSALSWRDEVEAALGRLIGVVRPTPKPSPEQGRRMLRRR